MSPDFSKEENDRHKEKEHFLSVVNAFHNYRADSKANLSHVRSKSKQSLSDEQSSLLEKQGYFSFLDDLERKVEENGALLDGILGDICHVFENDNGIYSDSQRSSEYPTSLGSIEKVQSVLKMFVRDWSSHGSQERSDCYGRILDELEALYDPNVRKDVRVLVPGAGMGRLAFDVAKRGFNSEGNEFSLFMLFASNFILNKTKYVDCFTVHPWIHSLPNCLKQEHVLQPIRFPDVDPNELQEGAQFSMIAGDFLEVYGRDASYESSFDVLISCFFLDCAHNVIDFIQTIHKVLKPGGTWINFGPLLYHYADMREEDSIEPNYAQVRSLIQNSGFTFKKEDPSVPAVYNQNPNSMLQYKYNCVFFTCTKNSS
eukprot:TRINITY_DN21587_c0_g1_i1.p1 TRINITY_DN21587_c0_g1~~TRINITY_DN21587_c0_g1_i1.p1  ORF type:complete len:378 (-),score=112.84 TRINITY_DN21587_c0_g1_i1:99-1211(-)